MHELSITQEIVDTVENARLGAGAHLVVTNVRIQVGRFTAVVPEYVRHYFKILTENTPLEGAELIIDLLPIIAKCRECGTKYTSDSPILQCPECGHERADVLQGHELLVDSIEVDDPDGMDMGPPDAPIH